MLWEGDCGKDLQVVGVRSLEVGTDILEKRFRVVAIAIRDKLDEGVDKDWPEKLGKLKLF